MPPSRQPSRGPRRLAVGATRAAASTRASSNPARVSALHLADAMLVHTPKRRRTAFLLCLCLGWLGAHRFYVGKRGTGRLYLFTSGLLFVGVIADLVFIVSGSFEDASGRPLA
jgi:hypothetical protein